MVDEFRRAIADVLHQSKYGWPEHVDGHANAADLGIFKEADAILAMPEMQAIKKALRVEVEGCSLATQREVLASVYGLPQSVIEWVLS